MTTKAFDFKNMTTLKIKVKIASNQTNKYPEKLKINQYKHNFSTPRYHCNFKNCHTYYTRNNLIISTNKRFNKLIIET